MASEVPAMGSKDDSAVTIDQANNAPSSNDSKQIDAAKSRFPCCIVWTPLPGLSWFFPCMGHVGICREDGVILDFSAPNHVGVDKFAFGAPARYLPLNKDECSPVVEPPAQEQGGEKVESGEAKKTMSWDEALEKSTQEYQQQSYNIMTCNCHSFVANCLNRLKYQGGNWNVANVAGTIFSKGKYVDRPAVRRTYLPFVVVFLLGFILLGGFFLDTLFLFILIVVGWFVLGSYGSKKLIYV